MYNFGILYLTDKLRTIKLVAWHFRCICMIRQTNVFLQYLLLYYLCPLICNRTKLKCELRNFNIFGVNDCFKTLLASFLFHHFLLKLFDSCLILEKNEITIKTQNDVSIQLSIVNSLSKITTKK